MQIQRSRLIPRINPITTAHRLASQSRIALRYTSSRPAHPSHTPRPDMSLSMLAGVVAGLGAGYLLTRDRTTTETIQTTFINGKPAEIRLRENGKVFDIVTPGKKATSTHATLSPEEVQAFLVANERSVVFEHRTGNPILRWDTNVVGANEPCEDRVMTDLVARGDIQELIDGRDKPFWHAWRDVRARALSLLPWWITDSSVVTPGDGTADVAMVTVLDGHQGAATVDLIRKTLHPTLAYALGKAEAWVDREKTAEVVQKAFAALDADILQSALDVASALPPSPADQDDILPYPRPSQVIRGFTEYVGACALTAVVDAKEKVVHIANLGDCRGVAGWHDPRSGKWRAEVLNSEHSPQDPAEQAKIYADHPGEEGQAIYSKGNGPPKLMGFGDMTRAFGDSHLKREAEDSKLVEEAMDSLTGYPIKPYKTPPYKTALPDVITRPLQLPTGEQLKFVILATDGLWERMTPEEACLLTVAAQYSTAEIAPAVPKTAVTSLIPFEPPAEPRPWPVDDLPCTTPQNSEGVWQFKDENAATHLIRNCVARGDERLTKLMLSARGVLVRQMRDDTAVTVVFFK